MTRIERQQLLDAARAALLERFPGALAIYVYGSYASGEAQSGSDLDLAILLPPEHPGWDRLTVTSELALHAGREVDLVDLRRASDVLRHQVLENGTLIHTSDPGRVLAWEATAMTRYGHYREEVRDLMADFHRTGVGYGQ